MESDEVMMSEGNVRVDMGPANTGDLCGLSSAVQSSDVTTLLLDNRWDFGHQDRVPQARTIQRAWRHYKERHHGGAEQNANQMQQSCCASDESFDVGKEEETCSPASPPSEADLSEADSGNQAMSVSSPEECPARTIHDSDDGGGRAGFAPQDYVPRPPADVLAAIQAKEAGSDDEEEDDEEDDDGEEDEDDEDEDEDGSDSDSVLSDGCNKASDVSAGDASQQQPALRLFERNVQNNDNSIRVAAAASKEDDDDDDSDMTEVNEQIAKRARKHNYLTLAQEFATFKKSHPDALPFNVHKMCQMQAEDEAEKPKEDSRSFTIPQSDDTRAARNDLGDEQRYGDFPPFPPGDDCRERASSRLPKTDVPDILKLDGLELNGRPKANKYGQWFEGGGSDAADARHVVSSDTGTHSSVVTTQQVARSCGEANGGDHGPTESKFQGTAEVPSDASTYTPVVSTYTPVTSTYMPVASTYTPVASTYTPVAATYTPVASTCTPVVASHEHCPPANMAPNKPAASSFATHNGCGATKSITSMHRPPANMVPPRRDCERSPATNCGRSRNNSRNLQSGGNGGATKAHGGGGGGGNNWHRSKFGGANNKEFGHNRRDMKLSSPELLGGFDVYNIETAMPTIDWAAMEEHLARSAKEELHWRRRNDREEIRRRLATGSDTEDYYGGERMMRKPSLQTRLQSGMNLQICFMNETAGRESDNLISEAAAPPHHETGAGHHHHAGGEAFNRSRHHPPPSTRKPRTPPTSSSPPMPPAQHQQAAPTPSRSAFVAGGDQATEDLDFVSQQARLQAEARLALAQAKEMAHMQMEVEKQRKKKSPIAEMVGITFPDGRRRTSRQVLLEMNVAQLQVIVNDLHTQIETLNEELVRLLLERDDLHMEQDSMLVDIEDLTRYLGAKDEAQKEQPSPQPPPGPVAKHHPLPLLKLKLKK